MKRIVIFTLALFFLFSSLSFGEEEKEEEKRDVLELGEVIITATKTERTVGEVPAVVEVITKEEIEARGVKTVQDALKLIPGLKVTEHVGTWGDKGHVQIMGLDAKHTMVLMNGQRVLGGHASAIDLQAYPVEMIERIEVVKGPFSALYGSDAVGGVVNIITKSPPVKPTVSASTGFGSRNTQVHSSSAGFSYKGFGGFLNYTYRKSDGVHDYYDRYYEHMFQGNFQYEFPLDIKLSIQPYYSKNRMDWDYKCSRGTIKRVDMHRTQKRFGLNTIGEWLPDEVSKLTVRGSWFDYKHYTKDRKSDWVSDNYEGEVAYSRLVKLFGEHTFTGGYSYLLQEIDDDGKKFKADAYTHGFFIQDEWNIIDPLTVVLGLRVDDHKEWGTQYNPKGSLSLEVVKGLRLLGSVGKAFRSPTLVKLYADGWKMGPWNMHANPNLEPEESMGYQAGVEYTYGDTFLGRLVYFRNEVEDLIDSKRVGPDMYWINVEEAITQGLELSLTFRPPFRPLKNLTAFLGYTLLHTRDRQLHRELDFRPRHKVDVELQYDIPQIAFKTILEVEYIGERYAYTEIARKLDDYAIVNLAFTKEITEIKGLPIRPELFLRIDNLFNKKNVGWYYSDRCGQKAYDEYDIDGVQVFGGLKLTF
ncbi:MAG: TonB-dependent receptor [Deltaproteobacteria bacterium]|nr:TonB-dependent receptor [Deltaproteobacteria bacterium]